jgi:hypothetical protein
MTTKTTTTRTTTTTSTAAPVVVNCDSDHTHFTVLTGNSCYQIASAFNMTLAEFNKVNNNGAMCGTLKPGAQVCVPASAACTNSITLQLKSPATCYSVTSQLKISLHRLFCCNPSINNPNCNNLQLTQTFSY